MSEGWTEAGGHTAGPWRYSEAHGDIISMAAVESGSDIIADVEGCPHNGRGTVQLRDARLIARAPDLLAENERLRAALKGADAQLDAAGFNQEGYVRHQIRAALDRTGKDGGE